MRVKLRIEGQLNSIKLIDNFSSRFLHQLLFVNTGLNVSHGAGGMSHNFRGSFNQHPGDGGFQVQSNLNLPLNMITF